MTPDDESPWREVEAVEKCYVEEEKMRVPEKKSVEWDSLRRAQSDCAAGMKNRTAKQNVSDPIGYILLASHTTVHFRLRRERTLNKASGPGGATSDGSTVPLIATDGSPLPEGGSLKCPSPILRCFLAPTLPTSPLLSLISALSFAFTVVPSLRMYCRIRRAPARVIA